VFVEAEKAVGMQRIGTKGMSCRVVQKHGGSLVIEALLFFVVPSEALFGTLKKGDDDIYCSTVLPVQLLGSMLLLLF
jgi:hypothetical protein